MSYVSTDQRLSSESVIEPGTEPEMGFLRIVVKDVQISSLRFPDKKVFLFLSPNIILKTIRQTKAQRHLPWV